jgi:hypothetical protein
MGGGGIGIQVCGAAGARNATIGLSACGKLIWAGSSIGGGPAIRADGKGKLKAY